jgi:hypothetical protein
MLSIGLIFATGKNNSAHDEEEMHVIEETDFVEGDGSESGVSSLQGHPKGCPCFF